MRPCFTSNRRGFTLIELLVVVAIIAMLAGAGFGGYSIVVERARKQSARVTCNTIKTAVEQFHESYSHLPEPISASKGQDSESDTSGPEGLVGILIGKDAEKNPRNLDFMGDMKQATEKGDGRMIDGLIFAEGDYSVVDAWGEFYYVKLDLDYDHEMDNPNINDAGRGRSRLRASCLVWCGGKDKNKETWEDNIMSWSGD